MRTKFRIPNRFLSPLVALALTSFLGCGEETPESPVPSSKPTTEQAKLRASDGTVGNLFGHAIAISGDTALIGAPNQSRLGDYEGGAYIFERTDETWTQQTKLLPNDIKGTGFGHAVALDGNVALVDGAGGVYIFERNGTNWTEQQMLVPPENADGFGSTLAIAGDRALVGAYADSNQGAEAGAVYVYVRVNGVWTLEQQLLANDGAPSRNFGRAVAFTNDTALVAAMSMADAPQAPGSAYVFVRQDQTWTQQAKLSVGEVVPSDMFGEHVALSGNTALISAAHDADARKNVGAAYVFVQNGEAWTLEQKIIPDTSWGENYYLGTSIALEGDTALLAASDGQVHRYQRSNGHWTEGNPLAQSAANLEPRSTNLFGDTLSLSQNTALVGAPTPQGIGSSYVFVLP